MYCPLLIATDERSSTELYYILLSGQMARLCVSRYLNYGGSREARFSGSRCSGGRKRLIGLRKKYQIQAGFAALLAMRLQAGPWRGLSMMRRRKCLRAVVVAGHMCDLRHVAASMASSAKSSAKKTDSTIAWCAIRAASCSTRRLSLLKVTGEASQTTMLQN